MAESVNWIHLTDLHLGLDDQSWLWPTVKHDLFRDLEKLADQIEGWDGWDLVFFTGDLTQNGDKVEFEHLNRELDDLWKVLSKRGRSPVLCVVPGNHDLTRPASGSAMAKTLTRWWEDPEVREQFWRDSSCEYRAAIETFFANYQTWASKPPVPTLDVTIGLLPGDFSATFEKGALKLGIVGLNSTFLQIASGDFKGKLDLHASQLSSVCGGDPVRWLRERTASVLLTHQPPSWLQARALDHFRQEIYPPGRFLAQFCGHLHEPEASELSEAGAAPRRLRQGPSVFGLDHWEGAVPTKRLHGYTAGRFVFQHAGGFETLWPRTTVKGRHGGLNLCPDHTYTLREGDCVVTPFDLDGIERNEMGSAPSYDGQPSSGIESAHPGSATKPELLQLLEQPPDEQTSKARLALCPRLSLIAGNQHRLIRQEEQSQLEHELRKSRCLWLIADWGTGEEGFLAASIERFRSQGFEIDVFHLSCDDAADIDALEALFPQQFGMPLQAFCIYAASLRGSFLVLDGIHPALCAGDNLLRLRRIASAIIDYCPELRLILVSRMGPHSPFFPTTELRPLDVPDVRTYVTNHPDATAELREPDVIERLHERSDGLPMHLDRMLRELKVSSLASVLEANLEGPSVADGMPEATPKALVDTVSSLARSQDKRSKRSFRLLKVLSVLPYGETLEALHHYLPTEPFFPENALQLSEIALLDVVPLQHSTLHVGIGRLGLNEQSAPKMLKVPRQVRDYIHTLLTEDERAEIVLAGTERFFGRDWRKGKVKLRTLPLEYREYLSSGAGNEFALIHHILVGAENKGDRALLRRAAKLGVFYAEHLKAAERYRDVTLVAGPLVQQIDREDSGEDWCRLSALFGEGLRMADKDSEALKYLKGALEVGDVHLQANEKASIWLSVALCEQDLGNMDGAIAAAEEVKRYAQPESATYVQGISILAELTLQGHDKVRELTRLEKRARDDGYSTVADNIALELARETDRPAEKVRLLDRVLVAKSGGYNQARAVVAKARVLRTSEEPLDLKGMDLVSLSTAYSYLHSQRFSSLFDRCHAELWRVFEAKGDVPRLLRLFRHASFVWRIRGDEAKESEYLKRLSQRDVPQAEVSTSPVVVVEVRYFLRRLKVIMIGAPPVSS